MVRGNPNRCVIQHHFRHPDKNGGLCGGGMPLCGGGMPALGTAQGAL